MSDTDPIYPGSEGMRIRGVTERYFKSILEYDALLLDYRVFLVFFPGIGYDKSNKCL